MVLARLTICIIRVTIFLSLSSVLESLNRYKVYKFTSMEASFSTDEYLVCKNCLL